MIFIPPTDKTLNGKWGKMILRDNYILVNLWLNKKVSIFG